MWLQRNWSGLLLVLTISWGVAVSELTCPTGWFSIGSSKCYKRYNSNADRRMWHRAAEVCESYGSHLVSIKDQYENNALGDAVGEPYWIGLRTIGNELKWHSGVQITENQAFWGDRQPDSSPGDCVVAGPNQQLYVYDRPYTWSFSHCSRIRSFVCEREAAPAGSFHCFLGSHVSEIYRCDGHDDCADASDEMDCLDDCHHHLSGTGNIDLSTYQNSRTCMWAIETPLGSNAYIQFTRFNTDPADHAHVYIGSVVEINAKRVASLSGDGGSVQRFRSHNNMLLIKFSPDSFVNTGPNNQVVSGFSASYGYVSPNKPEDQVVRLVALDNSQTYSTVLNDVGGVSSFVGTTDYVISIKADTMWQIITVQIDSFDLHDSDEIIFSNGDSPDNVLGKLCATCDNYNTVFSTGSYMSIYLRTERESAKNVAFSFTYKQGCHVTTTGRYGVLFSPGYPGNVAYPNFVTCTWQINSDKPLAISFSDDSVLQGDTYGRINNGDYVQIYTDGTASTGTPEHTGDGFTNNDLAGQTFQASNGNMFIRFTSSPTRNARGFKAYWSNDCEDPAYDDYTLVNGQVLAASHHYTAVNHLSCALGYDFQQQQIPTSASVVTLTCGYMGVWDAYLQIPRCTPMYCGDVPSVVNGFIKSSTGPTYGNTATYECFTGSTLVPAAFSTGSDITCTSDGTWSARPTCQAASCLFSAIALSGPNLHGVRRHGDGSQIGSIVDYECDAGYELVGEPILFCQTDGLWSSTTPSCQKLTCLLPAMDHGNFQQTDLITYQQTVGVSCNTGYIYEDPTVTSVTCQADRSLTQLPVCVNIVECDQINPCSDGCVDTEGSFYCTCPSGYYLHTDKANCLDVHECQLDTDNCDQGCSNNVGSYTCSCSMPGYVLYTADGTSGYAIPPSEDGSLPTDTYHIGHTCVLRECPLPDTINNGDLLTNRVHHRYGDSIEYMCDLGYIPRSTVLTCLETGVWSGAAPTCQAASCSTDAVISMADTATYLAGPYPYGSSLDLQCTVATTSFTKQRHCVYDRATDVYRLFGAEYQCGVVDCGPPDAVAGSNFGTLSNTLYQATFQFTCGLGQAATGTSEDGTTTVTCGADSQWNLGSLQCFELACLDPGYPAGGDITATSFADNSEVTFTCARGGYELSHTTPMKCFGESWVGNVPTCNDVQLPTFVNCDNFPSIELRKYGLLAPELSQLNIQVSDNTGIESLTISPSNANSTLVVESAGTVTYTARDYAGNTATCRVAYRVYDETPPVITCPQLYQVVILDDTDTATYTVTEGMFTPTDDDSGIKDIAISSNAPTTFTADDLYKTFTYTVEVKDNNDNVATCRAQIFVTVNACTQSAFPTPLSADKTCAETTSVQLNGRAYSCSLKCQDQYTFQDSKQKFVTCDTGINGGEWSIDWISACVRDTIPPVISCPPSQDVFLTLSTDEQYVDFTAKLTATSISDLNEIASRTSSIAEYTFTAASLYQPQEVMVTVQDKGNNLATCTYQYTAKPTQCSPLSYPGVVYAEEPSCSRRVGPSPGYDCTITALPGYILRDHGQSTVVSCNDGADWDEIIPAAVTDTTAPTITCPVSRDVPLATLDNQVQLIMAIEFTEGVDYTVYDIGGVDHASTSFSPAALSLNQNNLYESHTVQMTVYDLRGNSQTCDFDINIIPLTCSPLSLPTPANGKKICSQLPGGGYQCVLSCDQGYAFDTTTADTVTFTCGNGQPWDSVITACALTTDWQPTVYIGKYQYSYLPVDQTQTVPPTCPAYYITTQADVLDQMAGRMLSLCRNVLELENNLALGVQFFPDQTLVDIVADNGGFSRQTLENGIWTIPSNDIITKCGNENVTDERTGKVEITYKFQMTSPSSVDIAACSELLINTLSAATQFDLSQEVPGNGDTCPGLSWIDTMAVDAGVSNDCFTPRYKSLSDPSQCLYCPLGTNSNAVTCQQCPKGRYKSELTSNVCEACPDGMTTRLDAATSSADCISMCPAGSFSASGYAPCFRCSLGSYSTDAGATFCVSCLAGETTVNRGSTNSLNCVTAGSINPEQCSLGTEPVGDGTCKLCDVGSYRSANYILCVGCLPSTTSTYVTGATSSTNCYGLCGLGLYSATGLSPCSACPKGTFWQDSKTCAQCDQQPGRTGYTTGGVGATSINQCVPAETFRVACPRGTKRDGNLCVKCPIGEYQDQEDRNLCNTCGNGRSTYFQGATSFSMCFSECDSGFYSATGLSPCEPCGVGRYSLNSRTCENCGAGQTTLTNTAGSINECIDQCPVGQFSYGGYDFGGACRNCPANYYQDTVRQTSCKRCSTTTQYSTSSGLTSSAQCLDAVTNLCYTGRCQNGGQCVVRDNTYVCNCEIGYYGRICEVPVRYCDSQPCYHGGVCTETRQGHSCDCQDLATGTNCENLIKTCISGTSGTCKNGADCLNRPGNTFCLCRQGFSGDTCLNFQDICLPNPCQNSGSCSDVSFGLNLRRKCTCKAGFTGKNCETNIDNCAADDTCLYGGDCTDQIGDYFCQCPPGYGGKYCQDRADTCLGVFCGSGGFCNDDFTQDLPRCICQPGYHYGAYVQYSIQKELAPSDFGNSIGSSATVDDCRVQCTSDNQCDRFTYNVLSSMCYTWNKNDNLDMIFYTNYNTYAKDTVYPDDDFYSLWYNLDTPANNNNDNEDRSSLNSQFGLNICGGTEPLGAECQRFDGQANQAGITCDANGLACDLGLTPCFDYKVRFKCAAHRVFLDNICTAKTDYCVDQPCENSGFCSNLAGAGYRCTCQSGYTGQNCQTNINNCENSPCENGGTCTDGVDTFTCDCLPQWTGTQCLSRVNYCQVNLVTCNNRGSCQNPQDLATHVCDCDPGYMGDDCQTEINRCESSPCIHDGTCETLFNSYRCDCVPGFGGTNCEETEDNCLVGGLFCMNPATCRTIFDNYYCECPANIFGDNCENQPNPCGSYNKCLNGGDCNILASTSMECGCPGKYSGDGCQTLVDHCGLTNYCKNDGQCSVADTTSGYTCQCAQGYENADCDTLTNNCIPGACPGGTCYNDVGKSYCRCPLGKTGTNCMRDFDRNYDLFFNHPYGLAFAWIPVWTLVENLNAAAVSLWVRYTENGGTGIYLTMFLGDDLQDSDRFMEFMHDGIMVYIGNGNTEKLLYTHNFVLNDGNWHNVVFNYDMTTGTVYLVADSISHTQIQNNNIIFPDNTYKFWTVLGCQFDQIAHQCVEGGNNFHGLLSQVNWYHRLLDRIDDIPRLMYISQRQMIFSEDTELSDVTLVWNEYQLESGVSRNIPAEAGLLICDDPGRTLMPGIPDSLPPCTAFVARQRPRLDMTNGCPDDIVVYSATRITSVSWQEPVFHDVVDMIRPEYQPGGAFHWGMYSIVYIAVGANENTAVCHFKVYVQSSQCQSPPNPVGGSQTTVDNNPLDYKGSDIYCYDGNNYKTDRHAPNLFTCDLTGSWNIKKQFNKFRYPSCGLIKNTARVRIELSVAYYISTQACRATKTNAISRTQQVLKDMQLETNNELCIDSECSDAVITVNCSSPLRRRKRQTDPVVALLEVMIPSAAESFSWGGEQLTMEQYATYEVLGANVLDFSSSIPQGAIDPSTFTITATVICPTGQVYLDGDCVECGAGNYYTTIVSGVEETLCHDCPLATYQDELGTTSCKPCGLGMTTEMTGSYEPTACKKNCAAGWYFDNDVGNCVACEIGYYQQLEGQFYCDFCLSGETTSNNGSTSPNDCKQTCPSGEQLVEDGTCEVCPIGQYRNELVTRLCQNCNTGLITPTNRSTSEAACTVTACEAGFHLDTQTNSCVPCPVGTYQDTKWQTECKSCGDLSHWTTVGANSVSSDACKYYCPSGFEASGETCDICTLGFYKDNTADMFSNCVECGGNLITPGNGSTSFLDCSIYKCSAGHKPNEDNDDCLACPLGTYQPLPYSVDCDDCPAGTSTESVGSQLLANCEVYCPSGEQMVGGTCSACPTGTYKDNTNDGLFSTCQACPDGYTTAGSGTVTLSHCTVRACPAGTRRNELDTDCIGCDYGTYQDEPYQTACVPCPTTPEATSTRVLNATSVGQCEVYCPAGTEKILGACTVCDVGYYKDNIVDGVFAECTLCPVEYITETTRSTSLTDCVIGNCSAGEKLNEQDACEICPKGTFQPAIWQTQCFPCGLDKTTENAGAISADLCILVCSAGYEDIGGACQQCPRGHYKEIEAAAACTPCTSGYTTEDVGAVHPVACSLPACTAGEYLDRTGITVCLDCPYDSFQAVVWQESCNPCPDDRVTLHAGASSTDQCVLNCTSGWEYNPATGQCHICPIGFYRDQLDRTQTVCQACPLDKLTPSTESSSMDDCTLANCTQPGQYRDETSNSCEDCPIGTYNSYKWVTACTDCGDDFTTLTTGNTDVSACRPICVSGYYVNVNNACEQCPVGTYRTAGVSGDNCLPCPGGLLTPAAGAESSDRCTLTPCAVGKHYNEIQQQCFDCPIGTYQDIAGTRGPCTDCPYEIKYTSDVGATSVAHCDSPCGAGKELHIASETCQKCGVGYYQPSANQFTCIQCPLGQRYTTRTGATSGSECLSPCDTIAVNECSENATCQADSTISLGYECQCFTNHDDVGPAATPGRQCIHTCDNAYCEHGGQCAREPLPFCRCTNFYEGTTCQQRIQAEDLSKDNWKDIVIPVCIGVGGGLLLLAALGICLYRQCIKQKPSKPGHYSDFQGDRVEKGSTHSFDNLGQRPGSRMMLAPGYEVQYDNPAFHGAAGDSAVYEA